MGPPASAFAVIMEYPHRSGLAEIDESLLLVQVYGVTAL
jgi:hypothetical protein